MSLLSVDRPLTLSQAMALVNPGRNKTEKTKPPKKVRKMKTEGKKKPKEIKKATRKKAKRNKKDIFGKYT